jgi:hypothetical protein
MILKESTYGDGGLSGEKVFGVTRRFDWSAETNLNQSYGLETDGPQATVNTDGVTLYSGTHEFELTDGRVFEAIMGSVTGSPGYVLDIEKLLPSYSVKVTEDESSSKYAIIKGLKYTKFSINLSRDEIITVSAEWLGKAMETTGTYSPTPSSVTPLVYLDGKVKWGSTYETGIDNITLELQRNIVSRRFIEATSANEKRLITALIEGPLNITFNGSQVAKSEVIQRIYGGTSMQDLRSDVTLALEIARGSTNTLNLNVTGARVATASRTLDKNEEIALIEFSGVGIDAAGSGTYNP